MTIEISAAMERDISWTNVGNNDAILTNLTPPADTMALYFMWRQDFPDGWVGGIMVDNSVWNAYATVSSGSTLDDSNSFIYTHNYDGDAVRWRVGKGTNGVLAVSSERAASATRRFDKICVRWIRDVAATDAPVIIDDQDDDESIEANDLMLIGKAGGTIFSAEVGRVRQVMQAGFTSGLSTAQVQSLIGAAVANIDVSGKLNTDLQNVDTDLSSIEKNYIYNELDVAAQSLANLDGNLSVSERATIRAKLSAGIAPLSFPDSTSAGHGTFSRGDMIHFQDIEEFYVALRDVTAQLRKVLTDTASFARIHLSQVTSAEIMAGTATDTRVFSPADVVSVINQHAPQGSGLDQGQVDSRINSLRPNAFTDDDEDRLDGIQSGAQRNVGETYTQSEKNKLATVAANSKPFDIHDDVNGFVPISEADRMIFSDEGSSGDPMRVSRADSVRDFMQQGIQSGVHVEANPAGQPTGNLLQNLQIGSVIYPIPSPTGGAAVLVKYFQSAGKIVAQKLGDLAANGTYTPETVPHYVADSGGYTLAIASARDFSAEVLSNNLYVGGAAPPDDIPSGRSTFFVRSLSDLPTITNDTLGNQFYVLQSGLEYVAINDQVTTTAPNGTFNPIASRADIHIVDELPETGVLGSFYFLNTGDRHEGWFRWINFGGSVHDYEETTGRAALGQSRTTTTQHAEWLGAFETVAEALAFTHEVEATTDYFYLDRSDDTIKILDQSTFTDAGTVYDHFQWRVISPPPAPPAPTPAPQWQELYSGNVNFAVSDGLVLPSDSVPVPDDANSILFNFGSVESSGPGALTRSGEFFEIPVSFWKSRVSAGTAGSLARGDNYLIVRDFIRSSEGSNLTGRDIQIGRNTANHLLFGSESSSEDANPVTVYYKN